MIFLIEGLSALSFCGCEWPSINKVGQEERTIMLIKQGVGHGEVFQVVMLLGIAMLPEVANPF